MKNFSFIDLFAGIGGMRIPFEELGGKCIFSSENDIHARKTYSKMFNEDEDSIWGDIKKINEKEIPKHDILLAGFPCQPFSQAGLKKGFQDTRGTLFDDIKRIIKHHKPKAFLLENVPGILSNDDGKTYKTIFPQSATRHPLHILCLSLKKPPLQLQLQFFCFVKPHSKHTFHKLACLSALLVTKQTFLLICLGF